MSSGVRLRFCRLPGRFFSLRSIVLQESRPKISSDAKKSTSTTLPIPSILSSTTLRSPELSRVRTVPTLKTFYGGNPVHEQNINQLNALIRKHINLPTRVIDDKELQANRFLSFEEYAQRVQAGTRLKPIHHKELTQLLHRLRSIDLELMPREVSETLTNYSSNSSVVAKVAQKMKTLDQFGRAVTVGRRKRSVAKVSMVRGEGEVLVNGRSLNEYFPKASDRKKIAYPFQVVAQEAKYNVFAEVSGGGLTGQIDAIMYGIAKGLVIFNPLFKSRLHKAGLMTRDTRKVERKKPGKVKARKSPTWVKR
ncbi:37S ribosomal protein S9, mitochondrial [Naganishia cerealis]|uniref:37S ribosomal protein S9, mitochondrial n=1 Tax=Naganishia cerealis TaxID=610337 RepID=A0ACC2VM65_9TREE|nr:37S ribosomal protein S9, mitochondrial [Naganishia cerealis]